MNVLPDSYAVNWTYDTMSKEVKEWSQMSMASLAGLLEAQYRNYGIKKGYISNNQTIDFSISKLLEVLQSVCNRLTNNSIHCTKTKISTTNDVTSLFSYLCHIFEQSAGQKTNQNNISHTIPFDSCSNLEISLANNVNDIKQLLFKVQRPILLSIPFPVIKYLQPLSKKNLNESHNTDKITKCIGNRSCIIRMFPAITKEGYFFIPQPRNNLYFKKSSTFLVYGWNDDLSSRTGSVRLENTKSTRGGFIIKSFDGNQTGHSITYFEGKQDFNEEYSKCPNKFNSYNWIPLNYHATNINSQSELDKPNKTNKFTLLSCINRKYCNLSKRYCLIEVPNSQKSPYVVENKNGIYKMKVFEIDEDNNTPKLTLKNSKSLPFYALHTIFSPIVNGNTSNLTKTTNNSYSTLKLNHAQLCSYYFLPYKMIDLMIQENTVSNQVFAYDYDMVKLIENHDQLTNNNIFGNNISKSLFIEEREYSRYISDYDDRFYD